ncbi:hypothetical protein L4C36_12020 [Photobacterium japonica]|uniref:hypothetical protein n=1 Tax=Photobacterium japonica TaxID=2910235 RepID=UPI003D148365
MNVITPPNGAKTGVGRVVYAVIGLLGFLWGVLIAFTALANGITPFSHYLLLARQGSHEAAGMAFAGVLGSVLLMLFGVWMSKRSARLMSGWAWSIEKNGKPSYLFPLKIPVITVVVLLLGSIIANFFLAGV